MNFISEWYILVASAETYCRIFTEEFPSIRITTMCTHTHTHTLFGQYYQLQYITVGGYDFLLDEDGTIAPIELTLRQFKDVNFNASRNSYLLDGRVSIGKCLMQCYQHVDVGYQLACQKP